MLTLEMPTMQHCMSYDGVYCMLETDFDRPLNRLISLRRVCTCHGKTVRENSCSLNLEEAEMQGDTKLPADWGEMQGCDWLAAPAAWYSMQHAMTLIFIHAVFIS